MTKKVKKKKIGRNRYKDYKNNTFKYTLDIDTTLMDINTVKNEGKNKSY
ncbi:MAG: hypothetical protein N4A48_14635 [Tepidibacter sp.]|nr:hypothetical protein [Tepidibacter sp.]MCT4509965.1 hypothetical protein [Tepidibacter sp.]